MSYKEIILKVLENEPTRWFQSFELEKVSTPFGWIGIRGTRDCRELAAKGIIEKRIIKKYVEYKFKQEKVVMPQYRREEIRQQTLI